MKKAFDHVDHRAAFRAMKLQGVSLFSMALIAAIWSGSCKKARLGTVTSNKVQMSRGLPQGAPESPVIFTMIMELVLRDLIKSWISRKLAWRLDEFTLAAICNADDVVLIAVSVSAAETMVSEVIEKLKEVGLRTENTLDEFSEDDGQKNHGGRIGCGVGGSLGVCGIDGVSGRECKTCDRTQNSSSQQMSCKVETCVEFLMAPQIVAVEHRKDYDVAGFPLELECLDDGQGTERQNCELERENGGECCWSEKTVRNGAGTVVETMAQDWSSLDREMQYECVGGHQRSYAQLGWPCGKDGLQRNLREGSEMSRPSMVEMETAPLERSGERQVVWPTPTAVHNLQVGGHGCWGGLQICWKRGWSVENCPGQYGLVVFCSKPWKLEAIFEMWKEPCIDGPGCLGLIHEICDERADGLTHKICEERADELTLKIDGERVERLTQKKS